MHPGIWSKSRKIGGPLAEFAARICWIQLRVGRHFLVVESPAGSDLFHLQCFEELWNTGNVVKCNIPQCALGLIVDGQPICENTALFASSALLLSPFNGLRITGPCLDVVGMFANLSLPRSGHERCVTEFVLVFRP